jgi:hypothetical protein
MILGLDHYEVDEAAFRFKAKNYVRLARVNA